MTSSKADVVIIGGGIIGSAVAWWLTRQPGYTGRVVVIEKDPTYQFSSTTLSAASIRQQFSTPENIAMSAYGIDFLRNVKTLLDDETEIGLHEGGYLMLATPGGRDILARNVALQRRHGANIELFNVAELARRFPWLALDDIDCGGYGVTGEGWFDAYALLQGFRRCARRQGVDYITDEVTGVSVENGMVRSVSLLGGGTLYCGTVVNAAGAAGGKVAALSGLSLPVEPRKRCVFVFSCATETTITDCPLVVDPSGLYFRREGRQFITGIPPEHDPACWDFEVDYPLFDEVIWPLLAARVPAFEAIRMTNAWAGHYEYNTLDQNAILGPHPEVPNYLFANGFSGHGLQQAAAAGRATAELIVHGTYKSIDLSIFNYDRIASKRAVRELNVI